MQNNRRQFLKGFALASCAAATTLSFPPILFAQSKNAELFSETRLLMGTYVTLKAVHTSQDFVYEGFENAFNSMQKAETILSRHNTSSALSILNTQKKLKDVPHDLLYVAKEAQKIESWSRGAFNPSVLSVLEYMENNVNLAQNSQMFQEKIRSLFAQVKQNAIILNDTHSQKSLQLRNADTKITLDGIAKGYIVDKAVEVLAEHGLQDVLVNAGGDVRAYGMKNASLLNPMPWRVAIEDPQKQAQYPAIVPLYNCALATSGSYEKTFGTYNHLITATEQEEISSKILSVSVRAQNAMQADALATTFSCMPIQSALTLCDSLVDTSCLIVGANKTLYKSKNWLI